MHRLLFIGLFLLAACGGEQAAKLNLGDPAPAVRTQRLGGGDVDFPSAATGRPLVIRFWADWCRYCEPEMKAIEAVYQRHKAKGLEVFAINAGQDKPAVAAFIKKLGVTYPVLLDESASIAKRYGVVGLPTTYFVDAKGVVRGKVIGEADETVFERHALELLK
jgi:peroxiredoxin